jgi:phage baseplate assembly protein W
MDPNNGRNILGTGWKFPIKPSPAGGLSFSSNEQSIRESIWIILSTAPGERQMRPRFGCGVHEYVFAPNSVATRASLAHQINEALTHWEPRIDVVEVRVDADPGEENLLLIRIDYRIRANNAFSNLVYPFFIREQGGI